MLNQPQCSELPGNECRTGRSTSGLPLFSTPNAIASLLSRGSEWRPVKGNKRQKQHTVWKTSASVKKSPWARCEVWYWLVTGLGATGERTERIFTEH